MSDTYAPLRYLALAGNIVSVLCIKYYGIDEGFQATSPSQILLYVGMMILLAVNASLLVTSAYVRYVVIASNIVFALWFVSGWVERASQGTGPEIMSLIFLTGLLVVNSFLLYRK